MRSKDFVLFELQLNLKKSITSFGTTLFTFEDKSGLFLKIVQDIFGRKHYEKQNISH